MSDNEEIFDRHPSISSIQEDSRHHISGYGDTSLNFDSESNPPFSRGHGTVPDSSTGKSEIGLEDSRELSKINKMYDVLYTDSDKHTLFNLGELMHDKK